MSKKVITDKFFKYIKMNEIENTTYQNLQHPVLKGKFVRLHAYIKKEKSLNNLSFHLKKLVKEEQNKTKSEQGIK